MNRYDPSWRPRPPGRQFEETRRAQPDWPCVLAQGDSWFAHPIQWNILFHLSAMGGYAIRRVASIGDELRDMVREAPDREPRFLRQLRRPVPWRFLLMSGGGNDLLGDPLPDLVRHRAEVARGWRGLIRDDAVEAALERIRRAWLRVIFRTQQIRPGLPILAHGYDYPFARKEGTTLFWGRITAAGPWLYPILHGEKGITDPDERYRIVAEVVDRMNRMLRQLAAEHETFHHVELRGTLPSPRQWDDEIHPKSAGFEAMAREFAAAMARVLR
jgi:hypothetical protein